METTTTTTAAVNAPMAIPNTKECYSDDDSSSGSESESENDTPKEPASDSKNNSTSEQEDSGAADLDTIEKRVLYTTNQLAQCYEATKQANEAHRLTMVPMTKKMTELKRRLKSFMDVTGAESIPVSAELYYGTKYKSNNVPYTGLFRTGALKKRKIHWRHIQREREKEFLYINIINHS